MNKIYIEAFSGLSGNMLLSAFSELLGDYKLLLDLPQKLHLSDAEIEIMEVNKNGINCKYIEVIDLNLEKDTSVKTPDNQVDKKGNFHSHENDHGHGHYHNHDSHNHRHLKDIQELIDKAHISDGAKKIAHEIFLMIGEAESKIHNISLDVIHFHEISGVDSIIDIVGNAVLIDKLNIGKVYCTSICTGFGMVKTEHGMLPVPAPATAELLKGMPIYPGLQEGEKITPTGAAILKYLSPEFATSNYVLQKVAYGPGKKDFDYPNVVRVSLLANVNNPENIEYLQLETSIDDMSPEFLGSDFQKGLLDSGAVDFGISQHLMKKGRYAFSIKIVLQENNLDSVANYLFDNTSTIGLRYHKIKRIELSRKILKKKTVLGDLIVKEVTTPTQNVRYKPEYDNIKNMGIAIGESPYQVINKLNYK